MWKVKHDIVPTGYLFDTEEEAIAKCKTLNYKNYEDYFKDFYPSFDGWRLYGEPWDFYYIVEEIKDHE